MKSILFANASSASLQVPCEDMKSAIANRAIQPRHDSDEDLQEAISPNNDSVKMSDQEEGTDDNTPDSSVQSSEQSEEEDVQEISFGALAEAQARFNPNPKKRKLADRDENTTDANTKPQSRLEQYERSRKPIEQNASRTSKHAPTILSTRKPVSRKRAIFSPPPAAKFRDPRFDAAIVADAIRGHFSSTQNAAHNYSFLTEYQASEILQLKSQLKNIKDSDEQMELKRKIMSIEARVRNARTQKRETEILQEHKKKEREAIKEGKKSKPYFLKPSEVKKQIYQERQEAMGKKARDTAEKRKKKREKTKEARDMPRTRRVLD